MPGEHLLEVLGPALEELHPAVQLGSQRHQRPGGEVPVQVRHVADGVRGVLERSAGGTPLVVDEQEVEPGGGEVGDEPGHQCHQELALARSAGPTDQRVGAVGDEVELHDALRGDAERRLQRVPAVHRPALHQALGQSAGLRRGVVEPTDHVVEAPGGRLVAPAGVIPAEAAHEEGPLVGQLRPNDRLLLSANLAPGRDYAAGVKRILPQYDNKLTRDWLMAFLLDLGVERSDGEFRFVVEACPQGTGLRRVIAEFHFKERRCIQAADEQFEFLGGDAVRLFFSYRHTPDRVRSLLQVHGITVLDQWITRSEEEGVFLCRRTG